MNYEKASAEVVYFTNRDVITTSGGGGMDIGGSCTNHGFRNQENCNPGGHTNKPCPGGHKNKP